MDIGGISSAIGSIAGSLISAKAARDATNKQIDWERERATNAHQWEVQDLIKAGLNPILSAGGSGAVTGGISAPIPDTSGISSAIETGINTAQAVKTAKKERELMNQQIKQSKSQETLNASTAALNYENAANTAQATRKLTAEADIAEATRAAKMPYIEQEQRFNTSPIGSKLNYAGMAVNQISPVLTGVVGMGVGGVLKGINSAKGATKATKAIQRNQKWYKSVKMDAKAGQMRLPMVKIKR